MKILHNFSMIGNNQSLFDFLTNHETLDVVKKNSIKDFNNKNLSFEKIRDIFDELNKDESHFINSNDICTPMDCVKEMVDTIPDSFWQKQNLKILDSCCGNGNFHAYIATKTSLNNLYFNEINKKRIANLKNYFGENINVTVEDFLAFDNQQKYDLVVSNPPYAKFNGDTRASKNHNLARAFIKKALDITKENGYILFIVPNNWMSFSDRNILPKELSQYQFIHLDIHGAKKWFKGVGSSFTWFLLKKTKNLYPFTIHNNYVLKDVAKVKIDEGQNFIPLYLSQTVYDLLQKTINNKKIPKYKIETTSDLHHTTKKYLLNHQQDGNHPFKLIHTPTQIVWSKRPHKFQKGWKVFISLTNQYSTFIDNCGMTQSIAFIRCQSKKEAKAIQEELASPIYKFLNNITRYGNFNNVRVLQNFPLLQHISLTQKELEFVNYFNSRYYDKKK